MERDSEVTGLSKMKYHKTDKTFSAPAKSSHIFCHLLAHKQLQTSSRTILFQQSQITVTIVTHSIQLMEVFFSGFCFAVFRGFVWLCFGLFKIRGILVKLWHPGCQQRGLCSSASSASTQGWDLTFQRTLLKTA